MEPNQTGGKLLGQGVYGCVFDKPLKCKGRKVYTKTKGTTVGKITEKEMADHETSISATISKVANADKYFILIEQSCTPLSRSNQTEPDLNKCDFIKEGVPLPKSTQLIMPLGGKTLFMYPITARTIQYVPFVQHLLEAGTMLLMAKVVHSDLHWQNILVDSPSKTRIIDYGIAWKPDTLTLSSVEGLHKIFSPTTIEPPEVLYINAKNQNVSEQRFYAKLHDEKLMMILFEQLLGYSREEQFADLKAFIKGSWSLHEENWYSFYKLYWSKIDAYAFGSVFATTLSDLMMDPEFEKQEGYLSMSQKAKDLIRGLCDADPSHRLDAAEALAIWAPNSPLLQEKAVKTWIEEQQKIRHALESK
jgi:serine/threonine protein kinase